MLPSNEHKHSEGLAGWQHPQDDKDITREALNMLLDSLFQVIQTSVTRFLDTEEELSKSDKVLSNFIAAQRNLISVMND